MEKHNSENDLHQIVNLHDHHLDQKENHLYLNENHLYNSVHHP